jgi:FkbM family methyltransferase
MTVNGCPSTPPRLIYDIGFHNGDDSAYYLYLGARVVAVEANPILALQGRRRFASEIAAGSLTILNAAVWHVGDAKLSFYINHTDSRHSSIDPERGMKGGRYQEVQIGTASIADLFDQHGVPWYMKIDIEGADEMVIRSLPRNGGVPQYLSFELNHGFPAVDLLSPLGYTCFKLINPDSLTQSLPIFEHEFAMRLLRKPSVLAPPLRSLIANLPTSIRPKKTLWDRPRDRLGYRFSNCTTGPFGEDADGRWKGGAEMRSWLEYVYGEYTRAGCKDSFWYDLHAKNTLM